MCHYVVRGLVFILMCVATYYLRTPSTWDTGGMLLILGFCVLGLSLRYKPNILTWDYSPNTQIAMSKFSIFLALIGFGCLLAVGEFSGNIRNDAYDTYVTHHSQFILLLMGMLFVTLGFSNVKHIPLSLRPSYALIAIMIFALIVRLWRLETAVHYFIDEIHFAKSAQGTARLDFVPLVAPFADITSFPWIYPYWQTFGIVVLGQTLSALRIVSAILGTLSIPALYYLTKELLDRRIALLSALLLASFPPHIHFSRLGINNIADPLVGILLLLFMVRGMKYGKQSDFALAGCMLGLSQYFYEGGRIFFPILAIIWAAYMILRSHVTKHVVLFLIVGVIVAIPVYYTIVAQDLPLFHRFDIAGVGGSYWHKLERAGRLEAVENHLSWPFLLLVGMPEHSLFYGGETPLLLAYITPFFLVGAAYSMWKILHPVYLLLVLWVLGTCMGNMILANSAYAARYVVAFPTLVLLIAVGMKYILPDRNTILILAGIILAVVQVHYYFNEHLSVYNRQLRQSPDIQDVLFRSTEFAPATQVCIVTPQVISQGFYQDVKHYVAEHIHLCFLGKLTEDDVTVDTIFFVEPNDMNSQRVLERFMDGPIKSPYNSIQDDKQFYLYIPKPPYTK